MVGAYKKTTLFTSISLLLLLLLLLRHNVISAFDNAHFYRAAFFNGEPRFEKKCLTSFDFWFSGGSTCQGIRCDRQKTCLLDLYGTHNMRLLGKNVPGKDLSKETDIILEMLTSIPSRNNFGQLSFRGNFSISELNFLYTQNITRGFFAQAHIPYRKLRISCIQFCDLSPTDDKCPNINNQYWKAFLNLFDDILQAYHLNIKDFCGRGLGDFTFLVGWTKNYENTTEIDFIDATVKTGILAPTGNKKNENKVFSLPLGYDGHIGFPISFDSALGLYDWLTIGAHIDFIYFLNKSKNIRVKTDKDQSGLIKLTKECVCVEKGAVWNAGIYTKADHVIGGFSLILGYTFSAKQRDHLSIYQNCNSCIDCAIINSDETLKQWHMHTVHFIAEYDFSQENRKFGPRIGFFYNRCAGGRRVLKTSTGGATLGFEINFAC